MASVNTDKRAQETLVSQGVLLTGTQDDDVLTGTSGSDVILGKEGNDTLKGLAGLDILKGGDGNDTLLGGDSSDELYGDAGDDRLYGQDGSDLLEGGAGDDLLSGGDGHDTLHGGEGDDVLNGGSGNDELLGGAGNDTLNAGDGGDYLDGGSGDDILQGGNDNDQMLGGTGADLLNGGKGNDELYGGDGDDRVFGQVGNDLIYGGTGNDILAGGEGNDSLFGGDGNDILFDGEGFNSLFGGAGDDLMTITRFPGQGDDQQNILEGGTGNDRLEGWSSAETYRFSRGDGHDVINDLDEQVDTNFDKIRFGAGISRDDLDVSIDGANIIIDIIDKNGLLNDRITIENAANDLAYRIENIVFDDGSVITHEELLEDAQNIVPVVVNELSDKLFTIGQAVSVSMADVFSDADGESLSYSVTRADGSALPDWLKFDTENLMLTSGSNTYNYDFGAFELEVTATDEDGASVSESFVLSYGGGYYTYYGDSTDNDMYGSWGSEVQFGMAGNDWISGSWFGNDTLVGGAGNDYLTAGCGSDVLIGGSGDDSLYGGGGSDALVGGTGNDMLSGGCGSDTLIGGEGNDTLYGGWGSDSLSGGEGDDILAGAQGGDQYYVHANGGRDVISDTSVWLFWGLDWADSLTFTDIDNEQNLWFSRYGDDLMIDTIGSDDQVRVDDWFYSGRYQIETINIDGSSISNQGVNALVNAMSSFAVPTGVGAVMPQEVADQLQTSLAAHWS